MTDTSHMTELDKLTADLEAAKAEVNRLRNTYEAPENYACHVDVEVGEEPDNCVIDEGRPSDCIYAPACNGDKTRCEYWRPIMGAIDWRERAETAERELAALRAKQ